MADILESLPLIAAMRLMPAQVMSHAQAEQSIFPEVAIAMNLSARARMLIGQMSNGAMLKRKNLKRERSQSKSSTATHRSAARNLNVSATLANTFPMLSVAVNVCILRIQIATSQTPRTSRWLFPRHATCLRQIWLIVQQSGCACWNLEDTEAPL